MNEHAHHDELWAEAVSLLSAGCLAPDEALAVRQHLETCTACRERFQQLIALCGVLESSRPADFARSSEIAERLMTAISKNKPQPNIFQAHRGWAAALALAASLIVAITLRSFWPSHPQVAESVRPPRPTAAPPSATRRREQPGSPTLFAYERSFAQSSEVTDSLLDREARRLSFLSTGNLPVVALQELVP